MTRILARLSLTCEFYLSNDARTMFPARHIIFFTFICRIGAPEFSPVSDILDLALVYLAEALFEGARQIRNAEYKNKILGILSHHSRTLLGHF